MGSDTKTGYLFIAMDYVQGRSLSDISKQTGLFSEAALWNVLEKMTDALEELQKFNVVHRDIKPSNIMQREDGELVLMDLGIAKVENGSGGDLTLTMALMTMGFSAEHLISCFDLLFQEGMDPNLKDNSSSHRISLLGFAVYRRNVRVSNGKSNINDRVKFAEYLIRCGADVDEKLYGHPLREHYIVKLAMQQK